MAELEVEHLLSSPSLSVRHVRCAGTCRHRSAEECASATHLVYPYPGNARCDVVLASLVEESKLIEESIARGTLYARAGADGLFLPGIHQPEHIEAIVSSVTLPLNVMAWPGLGDAMELGKLGVRRLSAGSGISQAVWARAQALAQDFLHSGRSAPLSEAAVPYSRLQELFLRR